MHTVHWVLIAAAVIYIVLRLIPGKGWKIAPAYLRVVLLCIAAFLTLTPFIWLICSAFKDKTIMMQYTFLPPVSDWFNGSLNLDNFKRLLTEVYNSPQGPVYFWQYIVNSIFLSCAITTIRHVYIRIGNNRRHNNDTCKGTDHNSIPEST